MSVITLAVLGARGRTGNEVVKAALQDPRFTLKAAWVSAQSSALGSEAAPSLSYSACNDTLPTEVSLVIDFSSPKASSELVQKYLAQKSKLPQLVIATTGFNAEQLSLIEQLSKRTAVVLSGNTSLGVFALSQAAQQVQSILGPAFDIEILEIHHKRKKDAPSGTARLLADGLQLTQKFPRESALREAGELGIASLRGGDVVGEHTIYFFGEGERLELTHKAESRVLFARGALELGARLADKPAGLYSLADILKK